MSNRDIPRKVLKILWARSGGKCAICKEEIILEAEKDDPTPIGEMAHIEGFKPGSPRYNSSMTDKERNSCENLIILCPTCHKKIDKNPSEYPVEKLKQIKAEHEKWVEEKLKVKLTEVTFAELDVLTKHLVKAQIATAQQSLKIIPPKEKIKKNGLSDGIANLITMGMLGVEQVRDYLNRNPDANFADRLRCRFVDKYLELKGEGLSGETLFYELLDFASGNSNDFKMRAAGLKILTYFFELCEVFEK